MQAVSIIASGVFTAVGLSGAQTATSVRAGISRLRETDWAGRDGSPYRGGFLSADLLPPLNRRTVDVAESTAPARLLQLAGPALREAAGALTSAEKPPAWIVGVPSLDVLQGLAPAEFLANLSRQSQVRYDSAASAIVVGGRAAGLFAVQEAVRRISTGTAQLLISGGVDSYCDFPRLVDLDYDGRILNGANPDGFIPGEGAGFLVLAATPAPADQNGRCEVLATAKGQEPGHRYSAAPMRGDGLTQTLTELFQQISPESLPCLSVYLNLNGESLGAKEWGIASLRHRPFFSETLTVEHPAEAFGDAGAAMGPILLALAARAQQRVPHAGPTLVVCSADHGECAAVYLAWKLAKGPRS